MSYFFTRFVAIAVLCTALGACDRNTEPEKIEELPVQAAEEGDVSNIEKAIELPLNPTPSEGKSAGSDTPSTPRKELDLSLSEDKPESPSDYFSDSNSTRRYQLDDVFEKSKDEEKRLKFKSKLHVKEGATMEQAMDNYSDSIDGAEMGFEYKTK